MLLRVFIVNLLKLTLRPPNVSPPLHTNLSHSRSVIHRENKRNLQQVFALLVHPQNVDVGSYLNRWNRLLSIPKPLRRKVVYENAYPNRLLHSPQNLIDTSRFKHASTACFSWLVTREAAVPTGVAITVICHEVSGSTPLAEGK